MGSLGEVEGRAVDRRDVAAVWGVGGYNLPVAEAVRGHGAVEGQAFARAGGKERAGQADPGYLGRSLPAQQLSGGPSSTNLMGLQAAYSSRD